MTPSRISQDFRGTKTANQSIVSPTKEIRLLEGNALTNDTVIVQDNGVDKDSGEKTNRLKRLRRTDEMETNGSKLPDVSLIEIL